MDGLNHRFNTEKTSIKELEQRSGKKPKSTPQRHTKSRKQEKECNRPGGEDEGVLLHSCWADHRAKLERARATGYASRKILPRMRKDVSPQIQEEQTLKRIN